MTTGPATLGTRVSEAFYVFISKSAAYQNGAAMAMRRYLRTGDPAVLAEVLGMLQLSAFTTKGNSGRIRLLCMSNAGQALRLEYERSGDEEAIADAETAGREALALTGQRSLRRYRPIASSNLCLILRAQYERTGEAGYLREAVGVGRAGVEAARRWYPNPVVYLGNLATAQLALFEHTGDEELLLGAVSALRAAIASTRLRRGRRAAMLSNLGPMLVTLFEYTGDQAVLREAVAANRAAVAGTPRRHAERAIRLNNLGLALTALGTRTGDLDLIREAVGCYRRAGEAASELARARIGQNLALTLASEYDYTGELAMLREAVTAARAALATLPQGHVWRPQFLGNLGFLLTVMAERTESTAVLREAADYARAAVEETPPGHADLPLRQVNLGATLRDRYDRTHDRALLDEAIEAAETAVAVGQAGHRVRATGLGNLGDALHERFRQDGDLESLSQAVSADRAALAATGDDDPDLAGRLNALGNALLDWHGRTGDETALSEAASLLGDAAARQSAPVTTRIGAGRSLARARALAGDHPAALAAMEQVVALLPLAAPRTLGGADRRHRLGRDLAGTAANAAEHALAAGDPARAAELLEQARGLLMAEELGGRSELARLAAGAPDLLAEFTGLRDELRALDAGPARSPAAEPRGGDPHTAERQRSERRQAAAARWDGLLGQIRARPGLAGFLAGPSLPELQQAAEPGPIVLVSAYGDRGDALIVTSDPARPVRHVPLACTHTDVFEQASALLRARYGTYGAVTDAAAEAAERDVHRVLAWLWDTIAGPVLDELGYTGPPAGGRWPRLWWCPVGMLTELPPHAAGHHDDVTAGLPAPRTVLDRAVSSYTATIRVLGYSRQRAAGAARPAGASAGALIVAMPETPGAPLPAVAEEVRELTALMPGSLVLAGPAATRDSVLAALPAHPVAHFACHAVAPLRDEADGARLVVSGDADQPLSVAAISRLDLPGAGLAYLSACDTAAQDMSDEATPITSAFQLAGYGSVIGSLWPVNDLIALRVAADVYGELTGGGTGEPAAAAAAAALHHAIRRLRADFPGHPVLWSGHVHTGT